MKLNFWQWIGLIIFAVALILIIRREASGPTKPAAPTTPTPAPATAPLP